LILLFQPKEEWVCHSQSFNSKRDFLKALSSFNLSHSLQSLQSHARKLQAWICRATKDADRVVLPTFPDLQFDLIGTVDWFGNGFSFGLQFERFGESLIHGLIEGRGQEVVDMAVRKAALSSGSAVKGNLKKIRKNFFQPRLLSTKPLTTKYIRLLLSSFKLNLTIVYVRNGFITQITKPFWAFETLTVNTYCFIWQKSSIITYQSIIRLKY
jgi:hypothetical protein